MLLPLLLMTFLFSGCMAVAPESIAGEKERGTIATLLVTPLRRRDLALGKILSLSIIAILSGASSFIGTMLSLPNLMGDTGVDTGAPYSVGDYLLLFLLVLSTVLLLIALISIVSAMAKTIKEATTWVSPLLIVVMLISVTAMIPTFAPTSSIMYMIPLYNSVQCMSQIFSFAYQTQDIIITVVSNIVYAAVCVFVLARMFSSERVMFAR
jgi:sodium transport system permease protein